MSTFADAAGYRYVTTDLRYGTVIAELNMSGVSYSNKVSGVGSAQGTIYLDPAIDHNYLVAATYPGRTGLYILRDEIPQWGGIIWKRNYDASSRKISIQCQTFESYFEKVEQKKTFAFSGEDQFEIARQVINQVFDTWNVSDPLFTVDPNIKSGVARDRVMFGYEHKTLGKELSDLAGLENGFDYNIYIGFDSNGKFTRNFTFGYPTLGAPQQSTQLIFEYPGSISNFTRSEDADGGANIVTALGAGEGTEMLTDTEQNSAELILGYPPLESSYAYTDVTRPSTLKDHALADLKRISTPVTLYSIEVRADKDPVVGTYRAGDWARFRLEDSWLGGQIDTLWRITEYNVSVDDAGGPEKVSLTLGGDEVKTLDGTTGGVT